MRRRRASAALLAAAGLALVFLPSPAAQGQISPGDLAQAHAKLDGSDGCLGCHSSRRGVDRALCLTCHAALQQRIEARKGLHARPDHDACEHCHIEHQGRAFELVYWGKGGEKSFDHALAGYALEGAHAALACRSCHRKESIAGAAELAKKGVGLERTFLGLLTRCDACHKDAHRGQFGATDCASCHGLKKFRPAELFDHAKTKFPLTLAHAKVACERCHATVKSPDDPPAQVGPPNIRYRGVATTCAGCHKDPHEGRFGQRCESCHQSDSWKSIQRANFDHSRTAYPLTGKHDDVACEKCHRPGRPRKISGFERCATCHTDAHLGQFALRKSGGECGECHTTKGFRPSSYTVTDHEQSTYPLLGAHRTVTCATCHRTVPTAELARAVAVRVPATPPPLPAPMPRPAAFALLPPTPPPTTVTQFHFAATKCQDCHRDPHGGDADRHLGTDGCLACHALTNWREIRFDHGTTKFPIAGRHVKVACIGCHKSKAPGGGLKPPSTRAWAPPREVRLAGAPLPCSGCHVDVHLGQVGTACEKCHSDADWNPSRFDHDRDSTYKLEGAHRAVACIGCHPKEMNAGKSVMRLRPLGAACTDCHKTALSPL